MTSLRQAVHTFILAALALSSSSIASGQAAPPAAGAKTVIGRSTATLSPAIRVGNTLYLSGQLGTGPDTTIQGQTKRALDNMKAVLDQAGAKVENVVKCTVFLVNLSDFGGMNEAYSAFFAKEPPARSTVVVAALVVRGGKVEIECIAVFP